MGEVANHLGQEADAYNTYAVEYAAHIKSRDEWGFSPYLDLVIPVMLEVVSAIEGLDVLDACCGEGTFTRLLAARGARVVGVDLSQKLIAMAMEAESAEPLGIKYLVHDLTTPLTRATSTFDIITCNLALNDVADYRSVIRSLSVMLKEAGALTISLNNPYSALIRDKVTNYFDEAEPKPYRGLASAGVVAPYYHRTLEAYLRAFKECGLLLRTLLDLKPTSEQLARGSPRSQDYFHFPYFMVLELVKISHTPTVD